MSMLLENRIAVVVGGGQTPGETIGNGRATAIELAREGAKVWVADQRVESARETVAMIEGEGGTARAGFVDVTDEPSVARMIADCHGAWGRIDILHNNVGVSLAGGDAPIEDITADAFDRVTSINLRGMVLACKYALPVMRAQRGGVIINISSMAAWASYPYIAYKTSKAGVIALTEQLAYTNARYGIRANVILPGLMNTPMAIESRVGMDGKSREAVIAERDARVPLGKKMGTAWDIANAAVWLASDKAGFITGVALPVDGGASVRRG
jgi:NAD(P)-dependent dehydrogenase (short-subunit alcohol dehydrogenase family)